jgi:hypothetical protein
MASQELSFAQCGKKERYYFHTVLTEIPFLLFHSPVNASPQIFSTAEFGMNCWLWEVAPRPKSISPCASTWPVSFHQAR